MRLSIVTTMYNSARHIDEFCQRVSKAAQKYAGDDYELILVNDGSPDDSLDKAVKLAEQDENVIVINLSKNFGHHQAMKAGLEYSKGDVVFLIDSDLEEEPEWLEEFSDQMVKQQADVVYGVQKQRKGGWFERWSGAIYYRFLDFMLDMKHPKNITTARVMSRRYVDSLLLHKENQIVISCLWLITGFPQHAVTIKKRQSSKSSYGFIQKMRHAVNAITSFSAKPLVLIFLSGLVIFLLSTLFAIKLIIIRLFLHNPVDGWTSIMVSLWMLGGIIISFLGVIGIYLSKIFLELKQRPYAIIQEIYGHASKSD